MSRAPVVSANSNYSLQAYKTGDDAYQATLPFRDLQGEFRLNGDGANIRVTVPYRDYPWITQDLLWPIKRELRLYDRLTLGGGELFRGPITDITANSGDGTLSIAATDYLFYLKKRIIRLATAYGGAPANCVRNIIAALETTSSDFKVTMAGGIPGGTDYRYYPEDMYNALDAVQELAELEDGLEYYMRGADLKVIAGIDGIPPAFDDPMRIHYGGDPDFNLANYSFSVQGEPVANVIYAASNGYIGTATSSTSIADTGTSLVDCDTNAPGDTLAELNALALNKLRSIANPVQTPNLVFKSERLAARRAFDFGSQMRIIIDDGWTQYNDTLRVVGWQLTLATTGVPTTVVYTNDLARTRVFGS